MTPVDTGRARGNWQIGIGNDPTSELERKGYAGGEELQKLDNLESEETIYISNNLSYIRRLEYGWSKQAPQGMVGVTVSHLKNKVERIVKENEGYWN